jgi:ABC-2 type transport system ATP-binding protein
VLSVNGLSKTYRDSWGRPRIHALHAIDLELARGEIVGLLGPNGSGKTTLLKAILGLVRPTSGSATIGGEPAGSTAARRLCGYLPEESTFPRSFKPRELLILFGAVIGLPPRERSAQADRLLETLGLGEFLARRLRDLSRGTLRRIGFALALLGDPPLLLLDEPTSGMDPLAARTVREELRRRAAAGATVLLSTHLASDVEGLCQRVAVLARGRLLALERVERLLERPGVSRVVASGLAPERLDAIVEAVAREGGTVLEVSPDRESLEHVFRDLLQKNEPSGDGAGPA